MPNCGQHAAIRVRLYWQRQTGGESIRDSMLCLDNCLFLAAKACSRRAITVLVLLRDYHQLIDALLVGKEGEGDSKADHCFALFPAGNRYCIFHITWYGEKLS